MKTAVQFDFDGTVTEEDVSFLLLDVYVGGAWRKYLEEYTEGRISVGAFNKKVFGMMKEDEKTLTDFVLTSDRVKIRPGFKELVDYGVEKGYKMAIVSNGLTFYIEALLKKMRINGLEVHAAENVFTPGGVKVRYVGPDGKELESGFKEAYADMLCRQGYRLIYVGDGNSDIYPSRKARYVCATANLLQRCLEEKMECYPFNDFFDVIRIFERLKLS
jgi:2-hydroxy-3-keto-5-methylthiopentenyl-1-phosphate phosphatase